MATDSNVESSQGVRTYRGRTLEELLPQIREELGPGAIILREREGLVGGVGGFFAQRFVEVEARSGSGGGDDEPRGSGASIDIYDEDEELGFESPPPVAASERPLLAAGEPIADAEQLDFSASRGTPAAEPERSQPRPFVPPELQRERIIPRDPQGEPAAPPRRFETDVFLERLREASQMLPEDDEQLGPPRASALPVPIAPEPAPAPEPTDASPASVDASPAPVNAAPVSLPQPEQIADADTDTDAQATTKPSRPARRTPPERKPRSSQPRRARPAPRGKAAAKGAAPESVEQQPPPPAAAPVDPWTAAMAALVAEPEPERSAPARPLPPPETGDASRNPYAELRQRPTSLRTGLPTGSARASEHAGRGTVPAARPATPAPLVATPLPAATTPLPAPAPIAPLELRGRHKGPLRGLLARLFGGRLGASTLPQPSPPHALDAAAARAINGELSQRGASQPWSSQLIATAAAHGTALNGGLLTAVEAELARGIVAAPPLPASGAAVAFIGAGGSGKTRCTAALASAYSRASTLGVTVIAVDSPDGARELKRLLEADGVPVLSLSGERARQAITSYRTAGFVIVDTPSTTPTDPAALEALGASLAPFELDATFVTLPATLGPEAARRALTSFGSLNPSAVAITHADETEQLAVAVEIAITNRIPLAYLHAGTDHRSALSAVDAGTLAQRLLSS